MNSGQGSTDGTAAVGRPARTAMDQAPSGLSTLIAIALLIAALVLAFCSFGVATG